MARALTAALAAVLLVAVPGAGGAPGAETPRRGGTVVLTGVAREEPCLNTFLACSEGINRVLPHYIFSTVLPGAFREGPGGTLLPALVEPDVKVTKTRPFTLTYRHPARGSLERRGTCHRPPTSSSPTRRSRSARGRATPGIASDLKHVADVRALGERTVRVVLRSRFAGWRRLFPYVLPRHALAGADFGTVWNERIDDPRTGRPIGSGPFLVQSWSRGRGITLVRNPRYWGRRRVPRQDRVPILRRLRQRCRRGDRAAAAG